MRDRDLQNLRYLLGQVLRATGWRRRQLEETLQIGHGNLEKLLNGTLDLRVRHLLALSEFFQVRPGAFLDLGCPETTAAARREVADLLAPGREAMATTVAARQAQQDGEELEERIGKVLRRELERLGLGRPAAPPESGAPS